MKYHKSFSCLPFKGLETAHTLIAEYLFSVLADE